MGYILSPMLCKLVLPALCLGFLSVGSTAHAAETTVVNFSYTGAATTWTVPDGVTSVAVDAFGAAGGGGYTGDVLSAGGFGGETVATLSVTPGQVIEVTVGGKALSGVRVVVRTHSRITTSNGGFNGGGLGSIDTDIGQGGGGGGGATDVRIGACAATTSCDLTSRALVAGGGGGTAGGSGYSAPGGSGGALSGSGGGPLDDGTSGGGGGTQGAGGAGGTGLSALASGDAGIVGTGGAGAGNGGGGGGGYYGGGGGGESSAANGSGGGGGSGFGPNGVIFHSGVSTGDGSLAITYMTPTSSSISVPDTGGNTGSTLNFLVVPLGLGAVAAIAVAERRRTRTEKL